MKAEWFQLAPSVRAMISKELIESHKLSQTEAARLMGISQPAISQYIRRIRGKNERIFSDETVLAGVREIALMIRSGGNREDAERLFLELCRKAQGLSSK